MTSPDFIERYVQGDGERLRTRAALSAIYSSGAQGATMAISMATMFVLARLLTPGEFGVFAVANLYIAFLAVIADGGFPLATMQAPALRPVEVSELHWLGVGVGMLATLTSAALGPLIAHLHGMPELAHVVGISGITILISSLSAQQSALLRRNLKFGKIAISNIVALVAGAAVAVIAAVYGAGYWALVMQAITNATCRSVTAWWLCPWRPSRLRPNLPNANMLRFGRMATINEAVGYVERSLDQYALSLFSPPAQLGLYTRASTLLSLPTTQVAGIVSGVAAPALCRVYSDHERYRRAFIDSVTVIAMLTLPACALMFLCAKPIVSIVLGEQWRESADVIRALSMGTAVRALLGNPIGWSQVASGRIDRMAKWTLSVTPVAAVAFAIAGAGGATAVAWSLTIVSATLAPIGLWYSLRGTPVSLSDFGAAIGMPLAVTMVSMAAGLVSDQVNPFPDNRASTLLIPALGFSITYGLLTLAIPFSRGRVREFLMIRSR